MTREGTIAYRNPDGTFQKLKPLKRKEVRPDPAGMTFFARFLISKHWDDIIATGERNNELQTLR